jgi:hypothetical protein
MGISQLAYSISEVQKESYFGERQGGANISLTRVQACAKQSPAKVPLNSCVFIEEHKANTRSM